MTLTQFKFFLPPFAMQQAIVDILSVYDNLIDNDEGRINLLEETARLIFREWFIYFRFPGHEKIKITNGIT